MAGGRRRQHRSLACFVQALEGSRVVVELRQDTIVRGQLLAADDQLNLQLADASYQPLQGARKEVSFLYVKGRHVRFIHLPGNLDPAAAIDQHRKRVAQAVRQHTAQQQQQQAGGRLHKGVQREFQQQQQLGGSGGGGVGGSNSGGGTAPPTDMETD